MTTRLERQRTHPKGIVKRSAVRTREGDRGGSIYPDLAANPTGATPGTPGALTPAGTDTFNLTSLRALGALGETTAWTEGQYILLGNGTHAYWDGNSWEAGETPAP